MDGDVRINPYLSGNFAPVRSEDDYELTVTGEIPKGLRGTLYRTGPIRSSSRAASTTGSQATA